MEAIVVRYGLLAILLGAGAEGEPFALAGGVLAHQRLLPWWKAVAAAVAGAWLVDQFWFHLARHLRDSRLVRSAAGRPAFSRAVALLERHPVSFVLLFRFAYGIRAVAPIAIGTSRIPQQLFVPLNLCAGAAWGMLFTAVGYLAGAPIERLFARFGPALAIVMLAASLLPFVVAARRSDGGRRS